MDILLATSSPHKRDELKSLFNSSFCHLPEEYSLSFDCEENGQTFEENAMIKAKALRELAKDIDMPVLADDSGLIVNALPGLLGVKTARFGSKDGKTLLSAEEKNKLLIKMLEGKEDRSACFYTSLVMIFPDGMTVTAEGKAEGRILNEPVGNAGFGYDPVFFNIEANKPAGLFLQGEKNLYGHRGKAVRNLIAKLKELGFSI